MSFVLCDLSHLSDLAKFYDEQIIYLQEHINYPDWRLGHYPSQRSIYGAIMKKEQYAYIKDGEIIGAVKLNDDPGCSYEVANIACKPKEFMVIQALATSHKYYKRGIAQKIIGFCIEEAKKKGYKGIYCDITPRNTVSRNCFIKAGFKDLGVHNLNKKLIGIHNEILDTKQIRKYVPDFDFPTEFNVLELVF